MDGRTDRSHPPSSSPGNLDPHVNLLDARACKDGVREMKIRSGSRSEMQARGLIRSGSFCFGFSHPNTYRSTCLLWICCCVVANANLLWKKSIVGWLVAADWCWFNIKKKYYWLNAVNRVSTYLLVNAPSYHATRVASRRESDPVQQNQWLLRVCLAGLEPAPAPSSCSVV